MSPTYDKYDRQSAGQTYREDSHITWLAGGEEQDEGALISYILCLSTIYHLTLQGYQNTILRRPPLPGDNFTISPEISC